MKRSLGTDAQPPDRISEGSLAAFKDIIGDARVIGLGENGHGVGDFAKLRNQLLDFAASHLEFNVLAIEANFTEALAINDYVLTGRGDPDRLLANLHFWASDTQETRSLIEWIKNYNSSQGNPSRKVKFYGVDMQFSGTAYQEVVRYLQFVDSPEDIIEQLRSLAADGAAFRRLDHSQKRTVCDSASELIRLFDANRSRYIAASTERNWNIARQNATVLSQFCLSAIATNGNNVRDEAMAQNVRWILETEGPTTRVLLWAHNLHVSPASDGWYVPLGTHLRKLLKDRYVTIGQFFDHGTFRAWDMREADENRRSVRPISIAPAPNGYLEWAFAKVGTPLWALDLRRSPRNGPVRRWLTTPHRFRDLSTTYKDEKGSEGLMILLDHFDVIVFFESVSATRANPSGLRGPDSR